MDTKKLYDGWDRDGRVIRFAENFNGKLDHKIFCTIRKYDPKRYGRLDALRRLQSELIMSRKEQVHCLARILMLDAPLTLNDIPKGILLADTGRKTLDEALKVFATYRISTNTNVMIITLIRTGYPHERAF